MKMRLGSFGFSKDIDAISAAGFDCIEMHYKEIMTMDDGEFKSVRSKLKSSGITAEVFNNPLPLDKQIISDDFDLSFYRDYMKKGAERAAELGARFCNFGNGKTRSLPLEGDISGARNKIVECIHMLCDINADYNITVLIEPLSTVVSNFILSIPEVLDLRDELQCLNIVPFIDLRWHVDGNHPMDEIITYRNEIAHIHIDNPLPKFPVRYIPRTTDEYDYTPFFDALKKICYKGIVSCEANTFVDFEQDLKGLMDFFKHYDIQSYRA
jgi:sugar phosphate isomerase/epimerase